MPYIPIGEWAVYYPLKKGFFNQSIVSFIVNHIWNIQCSRNQYVTPRDKPCLWLHGVTPHLSELVLSRFRLSRTVNRFILAFCWEVLLKKNRFMTHESIHKLILFYITIHDVKRIVIHNSQYLIIDSALIGTSEHFQISKQKEVPWNRPKCLRI